ncbi:phosphotransferase enzyme family protein [Bacillus chungangensis]|uniref:Ser/Thr protein kinase RdoA (MazF antagonist) n=1 Tax=Bacillus chungangensis TaxID=587633 RepID=A0ABT9WX00_9BACI|nr:phosphotransferase [Bacillus chungangensis]MDQ0177831.1 Ser/Thr protein kinase RdoA (MazF antagonist) [Bacillus chungangensis]
MQENRVRLNGGFNNDVFYIEEKERVVRISEKSKIKKMVLQEIEWMNFLYEKGVLAPKPVIPLECEEERVKTYFEFIKGDQINVTNKSHWNEKTFEKLGKNLGRMHALSKDFKVQAIQRPEWKVENPDVFDIRRKLDPWIREKYEKLVYSLTSYIITPDTFGLIHNDYHQGNLIINEEGRITTIDFDDCSFNWYAQDIAVAFYHAYWQHNSFNGNTHSFCDIFMSKFFAGYKTENTLHKDIMIQIPIFLKIREIYLYQLFIQKWDTNNLEEWQEYTLHSLEDKINNQVPYAGINDFSIFF